MINIKQLIFSLSGLFMLLSILIIIVNGDKPEVDLMLFFVVSTYIFLFLLYDVISFRVK
jgi:hypothetical protein